MTVKGESTGFTGAEAAARLAAEGSNELSRDAPSGFFQTVGQVLREPMLLLLLAAGGVYLLLGDMEEALALLFFVVVVITITLVQERRTERALAALRDLSSPRALVVRDGARVRIAGREVVRGDLLVLAEGDRVAADALLLEATHLEADESLLTGESVPVRKRVAEAPPEGARPGGDDLPFVYAGTLVVRGHGIAEVRATGSRTEMGRIGAALATARGGANAAAEGGVPAGPRRGVGGARPLRGTGGGLRAPARAVARGSAGRHRAGDGGPPGGVPGRSHHLHGHGRLAHLPQPRAHAPPARRRGAGRRHGALHRQDRHAHREPDERGPPLGARLHLHRRRRLGAARRRSTRWSSSASSPASEIPSTPWSRPSTGSAPRRCEGTEHIHEEWTILREYPLSPQLLAMAHVWRAPEGGGRVVAAKGAAEAIARPLPSRSPPPPRRWRRRPPSMADDGLRVLAVARADFGEAELPPGPARLRLPPGGAGRAWPTRCGRACPPRWPSAPGRASAW